MRENSTFQEQFWNLLGFSKSKDELKKKYLTPLQPKNFPNPIIVDCAQVGLHIDKNKKFCFLFEEAFSNKHSSQREPI